MDRRDVVFAQNELHDPHGDHDKATKIRRWPPRARACP